MFPLDKSNCDYLFDSISSPMRFKKGDIASSYSQSALTFTSCKNLKKLKINKICIYELLTVMAVLSYAHYYNKIRFVFSLFDFDGNHSIDIDEI